MNSVVPLAGTRIEISGGSSMMDILLVVPLAGTRIEITMRS